MEQVIFEIIISAGNARALAYDALKCAEDGNFEEAESLLKQSDEEVSKAHKAQTGVVQKEAAGEKVEVSVLFVHAQDQLMTTLSERQLIEAMIRLIKRQA